MAQSISMNPARMFALSPSTLLAGLRRYLERSAEVARIERELDAYIERDLNDLGISRCDIAAIARGRRIER